MKAVDVDAAVDGHFEDSKPSADEDTKKRAAAAEHDENECVVCIDALSTVVLAPCGHKCLCETCAERIEVGELCPLCRKKVAMKLANFVVY